MNCTKRLLSYLLITAHKRLHNMVLAFAAGLDGDIASYQPFGEPSSQDYRVLSFLMPLQRRQAQLGVRTRTYCRLTTSWMRRSSLST